MYSKWAKKYRGLFVIVLWQAAPTQFGFGVGRSSFDEVITTGGGCEPDSPPVVETRKRHKPVSVGATVSIFQSEKFRTSFGVAYNTGDTSAVRGVQARGVIAGEWKYFGIGAGFVADQGESVPGAYLRLGPMKSAHLRLDMPDLSVPVSSTGVGRLGLGFNQAPFGGVGAFVGVPICYATCVYGAGGVRADVRLPVARGFDMTMSGFTHRQREDNLQHWGLAIGGAIRR